MIENIDESVIRLLQSTGMNEKQKLAYAVLLAGGEMTISEIAQQADLKRPITYVIMEDLEKLGYVRQKLGAKTKKYSATNPNRIVSDMKSNLQNLQEMLPYLLAMQRRAGKPHVQYFEGAEGAKQAFSQIQNPKEARYAMSVDATYDAIPNELARWQKLYFNQKSRPGGKHLVQTKGKHDYVVALKKSGQEVKYLPKDVQFNVDVAIVDGAVYIAGFDGDVHITVINSEAIYDMFCIVYDSIWKNMASA